MSKRPAQRYSRFHARTRNARKGIAVDPSVFAGLDPRKSPWFETEAEIERGLSHGRQQARKLRWVRAQMALLLSRPERRSVMLYYLHGLTIRQAASRMGVAPSSVHRALRRAIRKLRVAARLTEWFVR
jgi:RNA polymerase sigma factor (sigma-70 family)